MDKSKYEQWIEKILATEEEEISCTECFDVVSDYVDAELAGVEIQGTFRQVKQHLHQCRACQDEYELLREIVAQDKENQDSSGKGST